MNSLQVGIGRVNSHNLTVYVKAKIESMWKLGRFVRVEKLYKACEISDIRERPSHDRGMSDPFERIGAETEQGRGIMRNTSAKEKP